MSAKGKGRLGHIQCAVLRDHDEERSAQEAPGPRNPACNETRDGYSADLQRIRAMRPGLERQARRDERKEGVRRFLGAAADKVKNGKVVRVARWIKEAVNDRVSVAVSDEVIPLLGPTDREGSAPGGRSVADGNEDGLGGAGSETELKTKKDGEDRLRKAMLKVELKADGDADKLKKARLKSESKAKLRDDDELRKAVRAVLWREEMRMQEHARYRPTPPVVMMF